jgi:hypothetical protein
LDTAALGLGSGDLAALANFQFNHAFTAGPSAWAAAGTSGLTLILDAAGNLHLYKTGSNTDVVTPLPLSGVTNVAITGQNNINDALTVDFSVGNPIPAGGLNFIGGVQTSGGNSIVINGSSGNDGVVMSAAQITDNGSAPIAFSNVAFFGFQLAGGTNSVLIDSSAALKINQNNAVSAGTNVTLSGGVWNLNGYTDTIGNFTMTGGSLLGGTLYAASYAIQGGTATTLLAGPGSLTTSGQANLGTVDAANVTVNAGNTTANTIVTGTLTVAAGSTVTINALSGGPTSGLTGITPLLTASMATATAAPTATVTESATQPAAALEEKQPVAVTNDRPGIRLAALRSVFEGDREKLSAGRWDVESILDEFLPRYPTQNQNNWNEKTVDAALAAITNNNDGSTAGRNNSRLR